MTEQKTLIRLQDQYNQIETISINIDLDVTGNYTFTLNSYFSCSKVRITVGGILTNVAFTPGLLLYSNVVDNCIGITNMKFDYTDVGGYYFGDNIKPINGLTFYYPNKFYLNGNYTLRISKLDGTAAQGINGKLVLIFEYFL